MRGAVHVLLILGVLPGFLSQTIHVRQAPVMWAVEGSSITLLCDYNITGENASIGSYKWYRHIISSSTEVSDKHFSGRLSRVNIDGFIKERSAAITIHNAEKSDSGMFYCEVTFQIGREVSGHGNGTFLNVTAAAAASQSSSDQPWVIIGGASGGLLLLAVVSAVVYYMLSKKASPSIQDSGPIVYADFMTQISTDAAHSRLGTPQEQPQLDNSLYSMENQHYIYYENKSIRGKPSSSHYQEMDLYSVIH